MIYGLLNRAIRSEIIPAVFPPRNAAMKGLPRKNSQRRISMAGEEQRMLIDPSWRLEEKILEYKKTELHKKVDLFC